MPVSLHGLDNTPNHKLSYKTKQWACQVLKLAAPKPLKKITVTTFKTLKQYSFKTLKDGCCINYILHHWKDSKFPYHTVYNKEQTKSGSRLHNIFVRHTVNINNNSDDYIHSVCVFKMAAQLKSPEQECTLDFQPFLKRLKNSWILACELCFTWGTLLWSFLLGCSEAFDK